jgi:signal transduction histidine kinase
LKPHIELLPFEARARTLDHLGREQIADSPTAVSELWKNAFDAYATTVTLHVFAGPPAIAAVMDNGHGMSAAEFVERWLVVGTDAKLTQTETPSDRLGLARRERQGQKGIGRLSVAFLGPVLIILSRRRDSPYLISALDWRVFENPYLTLSDVVTPVAQFDSSEQFPGALAAVVDALAENIWPRRDDPRTRRVHEAWERYTLYERQQHIATPTIDRIANSVIGVDVQPAVLSEWRAWYDPESSGTALLVFEPKPELQVLVDPTTATSSSDAEKLRANLVTTLTGFVDPYASNMPSFDYKVIAHRHERTDTVVSTDDQFGRDDFLSLEHTVEGAFDSAGTFTGQVRAFGRTFEPLHLPPAERYKAGKSPVGPFEFSIGTFEQDAKNTTHTPEQHALLVKRAVAFAGLRVYRDGLRVMPYGRPDVDFFGLEERRTQHAGREFWQHHRVFGRVAVTKQHNSALRDKAGREGLIDNAAKRELRELVVGLLKQLARKYFGTDADVRRELLAEIQAENRTAAEARSAARKSLTSELLQAIRKNRRVLDETILSATSITSRIRAASFAELPAIESEALALAETLRRLRLPPRAGKLGANESKYLEFRERYRSAASAIDDVRSTLRQRVIEGSRVDSDISMARHVRRRRADLIASINSGAKTVTERLVDEKRRIEGRLGGDRTRVHELGAKLEATLTPTLANLAWIDDAFDQLRTEVLSYYERYIGLLDHLHEGTDVGMVLSTSLYEAAELEERLLQMNALAQMGITVEIIGHEFERIDREVRAHLENLPTDAQSSSAYRQAMVAYDTLVNRLRFLAPLQVAGPRFKERIAGSDISTYVREFFASRFVDESVAFRASGAFDDVLLFDYSYRILPVFVNLINNSLYWLQFADDKEIALDVAGDSVVIADSGPGVDPDDVESLFGLFFTRRTAGRGIGLYLAKANLGASGHSIQYRSGGPVLSGANFIITFRGMTRASTEDQP